MDSKYIIGFIVALAVIVGGMAWLSGRSVQPGPDLTAFTQCVKDEGAIFYGAFWCSHCQATKRLFGNSAKDLPYVECSTPNGSDQTQICIDKGIKSYPTWTFADGSEFTGEITLDELSRRTGCLLPDATSTPQTVQPTSTPMSASTSPLQ